MNDVTSTLELDSYVRTRLMQDQEARNNPHYDLLGLQQIDFTKDWDYSLPTIASPISSIPDKIKDIDAFNDRFNGLYGSYFSEVDFNNILIAGGAVMGTLLREDWDNDVDIFIYGLTEEQAINKVSTLVSQLYNSYKRSLHDEEEDIKVPVNTRPISPARNVRRTEVPVNTRTRPRPRSISTSPKRVKEEDIEFVITRNRNAITLQFGGFQEIQIILRLYVSVSEILHGFDLGSVAVGYDKNNVYFTSLGKFSYEHMVNIVDPTRRSTTYEYRLKKYLDRGFRMILPYLDMSKLKTTNLRYHISEVATLPYFTFSYDQIKGNVITLDRLLKYGNNGGEKSDYGDFDAEQYSAFYKNLKSLVNIERNYGYYHYSSHMDKDILTSPPFISISGIIDYYNVLEKRIYDKGEFSIKTFSSYFSVDLLPKILSDIFLNKGDMTELRQLIEVQKNVVVNRLRSLKSEDYQIRFLTRNPGTQLSGSFNPIVSDYRDWYGEYLIQ